MNKHSKKFSFRLENYNKTWMVYSPGSATYPVKKKFSTHQTGMVPLVRPR